MQSNYGQKLQAGINFPDINVQMLNGDLKSLGTPDNGHDWKLVVV